MRHFAAITLLAGAACISHAQSFLRTMPGYDRYTSVPSKLQAGVKRASLSVTWNADGKAFFFERGGKRIKFDIKTLTESETTEEPNPEPAPRRTGGPSFGRGQQPSSMDSPDGQWTLTYRNRNLYLRPKAGGAETPITTDGTDQNRVKYGRVTWTYNEELNQRLPFWWAPDSKSVAFYRFDESKIPDYYLTTNAAGFTNGLLVEPYPKAGAENPVVDLLIYDLQSKQTRRIDVRSGRPFDNSVVGHYVYDVSWSPDGKELMFLRSNRRQNVVEWCAANPSNGQVRVIVREENPNGWVEYLPLRRWLSDNRRFLFLTERNGFKNLDLYDIGGRRLNAVTSNQFEFESIVRLDEAKGMLYYMARGGDNPHLTQLYAVRLDGTQNRRMSDPKFLHSVQVSPAGTHYIDTAETLDTPPTVRLCDASGNVLKVLATSDISEFERLGGKVAERIVFKSADGKFDLYGELSKPSNFDPSKKYPVLVSVYNGPQSASYNERFSVSNNLCELGFLVLSLESRGGDDRGRAFKDAAYLKLGVVEIDDIAAGVRHIAQRPYVNAQKVGIYGTSYGGYSSLMAILRYPDLFAAACASSPVTDWRHYDTTYTERYMWIPQENSSGYDDGSAAKYASNLKGRLMLYYGTLDDNVHPANTLHIIRALQRAGKTYELQVTPDAGHSGINFNRMLEFFIENLVMR